jgi:integrase
MGRRTQQKRHGVRPFSGLRFVEDGKVKLEWRAGGRKKQRTIGRNTAEVRKAADELLRRALQRARLAHEGGTDPNLTLGELLTAHLDDVQRRRNPRTGKPLRATTARNYRDAHDRILAHFDGKLSAGNLRKRGVREWVNSMRDADLKDRTIAGYVDYLRMVYRWAVGDGDLLDANPIAGVTSPSRRTDTHAYHPDEMRRLLQGLRKLPPRAWRFRLVGLCEAVYGPRASQVLQLRWDDVDLDATYLAGERTLRGTVTFREDAVGSKGQPDRTLPMPPIVRDAFLAAWNHRAEGGPWVVWNWRDAGRPSRYDAMNEQLRLLEERVEVVHIKGRAFHAFRRSLATLLTEQLGVNEAARWIGDTTEVITRTYNFPTDEAERKAVAVILEMVQEGVA